MRSLGLIWLGLTIAACSPPAPEPAPSQPVAPQVAAEADAPLSPSDPASLLGTWIVTSAGGDAIASYASENNEGVLPYFRVYGGKLRGILTCNSFTADYSVDAGSIKIEAPLQTQQGCIPQEERVAAGLREATAWTIGDDGTLSLQGAGLAARRASDSEGAYELYGSWKVLSVNDVPVEQPTDSPAVLTFQRDTFAAFSLCTQYTGSFSVVRNELAGASELVSSGLTAASADCDASAEFFPSLQGTIGFRTLPNGQLELVGPSKFRMVAEPF